MASVMDMYNNNFGIELSRKNKYLVSDSLKELIIMEILSGNLRMLWKNENGKFWIVQETKSLWKINLSFGIARVVWYHPIPEENNWSYLFSWINNVLCHSIMSFKYSSFWSIHWIPDLWGRLTSLTWCLKKNYFFLVCLLMVSYSHAQIFINEWMSNNQNTIQDGDGDYSDWLELYNAGSTAVDLQGYALTDNPDSLRKYIFPSKTIAAGGFLRVWCSGKTYLLQVLLHIQIFRWALGRINILFRSFRNSARQCPSGISSCW